MGEIAVSGQESMGERVRFDYANCIKEIVGEGEWMTAHFLNIRSSIF
jgi:hypothetical protein